MNGEKMSRQDQTPLLPRENEGEPFFAVLFVLTFSLNYGESVPKEADLEQDTRSLIGDLCSQKGSLAKIAAALLST